MSCLAKAIFDNSSESPDELCFRAGDVLTVLEFDTAGLDGWWLCSWRGRRGLAPGNRLRVLQGIYESPNHLGTAHRQGQQHRFSGSQTPKSGASPLEGGVDFSVAENWTRRSWDVTPNKVVRPEKIGDVYVYLTPGTSLDDYDVPTPKFFPTAASRQRSDVYDTPQQRQQQQHHHNQQQQQQQQQQQPQQQQSAENLRSSSSLPLATPPSSLELVYDAPQLLGGSKQSLDDGSMLTISSSSSNQSLGQLCGVGGPLSPPNPGRPAKTMRTESPETHEGGGAGAGEGVGAEGGGGAEAGGGGTGGAKNSPKASSTTTHSGMEDYDVPKPFSPTDSLRSNLSTDSLYRSNSPPEEFHQTDIYDRPPSRSQSSCGSALNNSEASIGGAVGVGNGDGSIVSAVGGGFEGSPCKLTTSGSNNQLHLGSASTFNLSNNSILSRSDISLSDFRASETSLPFDASCNESIYDSPASTTALSPTRSIGCISNRSSSSEILGASSTDLKGSLNTIPEGKVLTTDDGQPDYDVPVASQQRRNNVDAAAIATATAESTPSAEKPALPQRNNPLHPGVRAEKAQTLPPSYSEASSAAKDDERKHSSLARKSSHEGDLPPTYQPQQRASRSTTNSGSSSSSTENEAPMEIPTDVDSAVDLLERLRETVKKSADKLLSFIGFSWRTKEELEPKIFEIEQACVAVKTSLKDFVNFAIGVIDRVTAITTGRSLSEKSSLRTKLKKQLAPLQVALESVSRSMEELNGMNWEVDDLIQPAPIASSSKSLTGSSKTKETASTTDALDKIVTVSRVVLEEVSSVAVVVQGNASLIFDKSDANKPRPLPPTPPSGSAKPPLRPKPTPTKTDQQPRAKDVSLDGVANRPLPQIPDAAPDATPGLVTTPQNRPLPNVPRDRQTERLTASSPTTRGGAHSPSPRSSPRASPLPRIPSLGRELDVVVDPSATSSSPPPPIPPPPPADDDSFLDSSSAIDPKVLNLNLQNLRHSSAASTPPPPPPQSAIDELDAFIKEHSSSSSGLFDGLSSSDHRGLLALSPNDKQILGFYSAQVTSLASVLNGAIETFFQSVDNNDGPKHFIAHSKILVLSGHKLVYIGDTLHRNVYNVDVKSKIAQCANALCDSLKHVVTSTKRAALQYPAVATLQQMVDTVVDVSHAAHQLKLVIMQAGEA